VVVPPQRRVVVDPAAAAAAHHHRAPRPAATPRQVHAAAPLDAAAPPIAAADPLPARGLPVTVYRYPVAHQPAPEIRRLGHRAAPPVQPHWPGYAALPQPITLRGYVAQQREGNYLLSHENVALRMKRQREREYLSRMERVNAQADYFTESLLQQRTLSLQADLAEAMDQRNRIKKDRLLAEMRANAEGIMELELIAAEREYEEQAAGGREDRR